MTKSPTRPLRTAAAALVAALSLGSCGTFSSSSEAFRVNGVSFSRDELNELTSDLVKVGQIPGSNGTVGAKDLAGITSTMIQYTAGKEMLETYGVKISPSDISAARAQLGQSDLSGLSEKTVNLLSEFSAMGKAFDSIKSPADIADRYAASPSSTGVLCISEITVASEAEARDALDRIAAGETFAKVASAVTLDKEYRATGGNVEDVNGTSCFGLSSMLPKLGQAVLGALARTAPGTPTPPTKDDTGWHIAVHRPWNEISADHAKVLADRTGRQLLAGFLAVADVRVGSLYGTWNPVLAQVE